MYYAAAYTGNVVMTSSKDSPPMDRFASASPGPSIRMNCGLIVACICGFTLEVSERPVDEFATEDERDVERERLLRSTSTWPSRYVMRSKVARSSVRKQSTCRKF